jgi:hypothetical protein
MATAELHQYFDAERQAGLLAAVLGLASLGLASYLWGVRSPFKAMAWPLVIVGLVELGIGIGLVMRTGPQVHKLEAGFRAAPQPSAATELQRMTRVNRSFRVIMAIELVLLVGGAFVAWFLRATKPTWSAVGMGLFLQASVMLVFDLFAEHRAQVYSRWLSSIAGVADGG